MKQSMKTSGHLFRQSKKTILLSMVIASLTATGIATSAGADQMQITAVQSKFRAARASRAIRNQYIVVLKDQMVNQQVSIMSADAPLNAVGAMEYRRSVVADMASEMMYWHRLKIKKRYHAAINGFVARMSRRDMHALLADNRIAFIEQDQVVRVYAIQNDAIWGLDRIDQATLPLDSTYNYTADGTGVNAYVIDTGVMVSHSDFNGHAQNGWDFVDNDSVANDCHGHGTLVAGIIAGSTYGVAKNVTVTGIRVLGCDGFGSNADVIAGIDWVTQNAVHPAVANMSIGGGSSTALDNAVQAAIDSGVTVTVAAGNNDSDACDGSPGRVDDALTVASLTLTDARSSFSNWGPCIDLFAPGSSITSTWNNGGTNTFNGTSMASPHVAGVAALYLQDNPAANPAAVNAAIVDNAVSGEISDVAGSPNLLLQSDFGGMTPELITPPELPTPPRDDLLEKGVAKTDLSGAAGNDTHYTMEIPEDATDLKFNLSRGTGDADLYVKFGAAPTTSSYDCRPYRGGNNENCNFAAPSSGTYYVMVRGFSNYNGVSLVGDYTVPNSASGGGDSFFENTSDLDIPDNNLNGITSDIMVVRDGLAGIVDITVDIKHTYIGDLIVEVFTPDGASAVLHERTGGSANDLNETYTVDIISSVAAAGTWQLKVSDGARRDVGYIDSWSITFQ